MIGKMFVSACLGKASTEPLLQNGDISYLFLGNEEPVFTFVKSFVKQYHALPSADTIEVHTGETLPEASEPPEYYHDLMKLRFTERQLKASMKKASALLQADNKDPEEALSIMTEAVLGLATRQAGAQMMDFRQAYEMVMQAYASKYAAGDGYGLNFGWPTLDEVTGGLLKGDVTSICGRPAAGKTWMLLSACFHGWSKAATKPDPDINHSRLFVSMEMNLQKINQRLAAMQAGIPMSGLTQAQLTTKSLGKLKQGLKAIKGYAYPFYVVDGNLTATVEDIWMLAQQLNPGAIFIDGAYLIKHPTERERFRRAAENADLIKQELAPIAPVVTSWQFAKTAAKKSSKKGEKIGMEDIGYTDAVAQSSSIILGLMEEESVETLNQRKIDILKGRNGETGEFTTKWDFVGMDFSEIQEGAVEELQFL